MENKSEYGIYEEFLKNFDSVNYKNKDSSIINNEFQKVISELCEKDMINVALQAELDRQVFLIRKSFEFQDDETKGTIKGIIVANGRNTRYGKWKQNTFLLA